ncbi:MAG: ATP-dependent DNA helicase, partial [Psychroserpens sp.]|nr:ATP-dependent DNA helicase [Psychroserpens sp.]
DQFLDVLTPIHEPRQNPMLSADIFGDIEPNQIRFKKPVKRTQEKKPPKFVAPKNLKPVSKSSGSDEKTNLFDGKLVVGNFVEHARFGKGEVLKIEGKGADVKAEINFEVGGVKKLLLRFAKLDVLG